MKNSNLDGITLEGTPIADCIDKMEELEPIDPDVNEDFKKNHHIYKPPIYSKHKDEKQKGGTVERKIFEMNKANMVNNIVDAVRDRDIKRAIVSVLLSTETHKTLVQVFDTIEQALKVRNMSKKLFFKAHSLRNPLGGILKSKFGIYLEIIPRGASSAQYKIDEIYRDKFSVDDAMKIVDAYIPPKYKHKKKSKTSIETPIAESKETILEQPEKLASFVMQTSAGEINVNIFGKIQIEFSFK